MNISLTMDREEHFGGTMESIQDEIDRHRTIMAGVGYDIIGGSVLIPEDGAYPGSYQVWTPVRDEDNATGWVFVDTAGVVMTRDNLPLATEMSQ